LFTDRGEINFSLRLINKLQSARSREGESQNVKGEGYAEVIRSQAVIKMRGMKGHCLATAS
jgi:hypothetical protein